MYIDIDNDFHLLYAQKLFVIKNYSGYEAFSDLTTAQQIRIE